MHFSEGTYYKIHTLVKSSRVLVRSSTSPTILMQDLAKLGIKLLTLLVRKSIKYQFLKFSCFKGQLISEAIFLAFKSLKRQIKNSERFLPALASKLGPKKNQCTVQYFKIGTYHNKVPFFIWPLLDARAEILQKKLFASWGI